MMCTNVLDIHNEHSHHRVELPPTESFNRILHARRITANGTSACETLSENGIAININRLVSGNITHAIHRNAADWRRFLVFSPISCATMRAIYDACLLLYTIHTHRYLIAVGRTERADRIQPVRRRAVVRLRFDRQYRVIAGRIAVRVHIHLKAVRVKKIDKNIRIH